MPLQKRTRLRSDFNITRRRSDYGGYIYRFRIRRAYCGAGYRGNTPMDFGFQLLLFIRVCNRVSQQLLQIVVAPQFAL